LNWQKYAFGLLVLAIVYELVRPWRRKDRQP
jgi:hypothetical protein